MMMLLQSVTIHKTKLWDDRFVSFFLHDSIAYYYFQLFTCNIPYGTVRYGMVRTVQKQKINGLFVGFTVYSLYLC